MIIDKETDTLYISNLLDTNYPLFYKNFKNILDQNNVDQNYIPGTRDVWCADYMPVQVRLKEFVQFKFAPGYLKEKKYHKTISDPIQICNQLNLQPKKTDIIADGGNIVRSKSKVIMTTRLIEENPQYSIKHLRDKIIELLEIDQLILIPTQPGDFTGHSDGMVRFLDENTVLLNDYSKEPNREFVSSLHACLYNSGLNIIEVPTSMYDNEDSDDANGIYINYLEMKGFIFLPVFNRKEDDLVLKQFDKLFPFTKIITVESNQLAKDGGILNCISWNIKE